MTSTESCLMCQTGNYNMGALTKRKIYGDGVCTFVSKSVTTCGCVSCGIKQPGRLFLHDKEDISLQGSFVSLCWHWRKVLEMMSHTVCVCVCVCLHMCACMCVKEKRFMPQNCVKSYTKNSCTEDCKNDHF